MVEIGRGDAEEVVRAHGANGRHVGFGGHGVQREKCFMVESWDAMERGTWGGGPRKVAAVSGASSDVHYVVHSMSLVMSFTNVR